jgi:hypothetical protein
MQLAIWALSGQRDALRSFVETGGNLDLTFPSFESDEEGQDISVMDILLDEEALDGALLLVELGASPALLLKSMNTHNPADSERETLVRKVAGLITQRPLPQRQTDLDYALANQLQRASLGLLSHLLDLGANPLGVFHPDGESTALDLARLVDDRYPLGPEVVRLLETHVERQRLEDVLTEIHTSQTGKPPLRL